MGLREYFLQGTIRVHQWLCFIYWVIMGIMIWYPYKVCEAYLQQIDSFNEHEHRKPSQDEKRYSIRVEFYQYFEYLLGVAVCVVLASWLIGWLGARHFSIQKIRDNKEWLAKAWIFVTLIASFIVGFVFSLLFGVDKYRPSIAPEPLFAAALDTHFWARQMKYRSRWSLARVVVSFLPWFVFVAIYIVCAAAKIFRYIRYDVLRDRQRSHRNADEIPMHTQV